MQKRRQEEFEHQILKSRQRHEYALDKDVLFDLAKERVLESGITDDIENVDEIICHEYTDSEI